MNFQFTLNGMCLIIIIINLLILNQMNCKPLPDNNENNNEILIIVSYDAFRNEYLKRNITPHMLEFRNNGVYADHIINVFPTKTFTNHHSIATGLYPETHGVTANEIYDIDLGFLNYTYELFHYNEEILPIWALNEKNGGTSGCMMWPGSNFQYKNIKCSYMQAYNSSVPMKDRIDTVISWLKNSNEKRPNLIMLYFETADKIGHAYGPDSEQVTEVVKQLDNITNYLQEQLKTNNLINQTNVIHLSDHGMEGVSSPHFINLTMFLEPETAEMYGTSPVLQVVPIKSKEEDVYIRLKNAAVDNGHFKVFKVETLPERWHSKNHKRFGPIIVLADLGYAFQDMYKAANYYTKKYKIPFTPTTQYGVHGYDNALVVMHPIFMAKGPAFKEHYKIEPFNTVDLFNLFCKILNIKNTPLTNGSDIVINNLLKNYDSDGQSLGVGTRAVIYIEVIFCGIIVAVIGYIFMRRKVKRNFYVTS